MSRYKIITTPTSESSQALMRMIEEQGVKDKVDFVDYNTEEGLELLTNCPDAAVGVILDSQENRALNHAEILALLKGE